MLTVGEILKRERLNKKLTIVDIEKATKIRKKNLEAVENEDWKVFSSKTYIIGIIKTYAKFLNLKEDKLVAFFRREYEKKEDLKFNEGIKNNYLIPQIRKFFQKTISLIFIIFVLFFFYQIKLYLTPPNLEIIQPKETLFKNQDKITLIGKTDKETIINVNNERVYLKNDNTFETTISLYNEKNPVIIEAVGANGKKTTISKVYIKKIISIP